MKNQKKMVIKIYISKHENYKIGNPTDYFDDFTSNFYDLNIWHTDKHAHGKKISVVKNIIKNIINSMKEKGIEIDIEKCYAKSHINGIKSGWFFGHTEGNGVHNRDYFNLPDNDRLECLLYHLHRMYNIISKYDETSYLFSSF